METVNIVLNCDRDLAEAFENELKSIDGGQVFVSERKNLDGQASGWLALATVLTPAIPQILEFVKNLVGSRKIESVQFGDKVIKGATREDIVALINSLPKTGGDAQPGG